MATPRFLQHYPYSFRLLILMLLVFGAGSLFFFFAALPIYYLFDVNLMGGDLELLMELPGEQGAWARKLVIGFGSIGMFVVPPLVFAHFLSKRKWTILRMDRGSKWAYWLAVPVLVALSQPVVVALAEFNQGLMLPEWASGAFKSMEEMEEAASRNHELFLTASSVGQLLINVLLVALIPAIGEELLFRGVLQGLFQRMVKNPILGIWITAFIFSAWHAQPFTFLPRFFLGALLGYLLYWSGSLWVPIFAHFCNNALAVISAYLFQQDLLDSNNTVSEGMPDSALAWFGVGMMLAIMVVLWKQRSEYPVFEEESVIPMFPIQPEVTEQPVNSDETEG